MKKTSVCKGCEYHKEYYPHMNLRNTCSYMDKTGHSRLKVELDNGGYQTDSCICYEKRERKRRGEKCQG